MHPAIAAGVDGDGVRSLPDQRREFLLAESTAASPAWRALSESLGLAASACITTLPDHYFGAKAAFEDLSRQFNIHNLEAFELDPAHPALALLKEPL